MQGQRGGYREGVEGMDGEKCTRTEVCAYFNAGINPFMVWKYSFYTNLSLVHPKVATGAQERTGEMV